MAEPTPQSPACDRCSQGVIDATDPHLWGECDCECHDPREQVSLHTSTWRCRSWLAHIHLLEADRD